MDLTNYYELKHQPHNLRLLPSGLLGEDCLALPPSTCSTSSSVSRNLLRPSSRQSAPTRADAIAVFLPHHFLDGAPPKTAVISGADGRLSDHHLEELYKER